MADKLQQKIGVTTTWSPAVTSFGNDYVLAWTNNDDKSSISWAAFEFKDGKVKLTNSIADTGFSTQAGFAPALASFNATPWMAFLENPKDAPLSPPEEQRREPPVIMVSSYDGTKWSAPEPVWDPEVTGTDLFTPGFQGPAAISAPAIAANGSEILVAWVENAVNGSDALAVFSEGQLASPPAEPQIFYATWTPAAGWTQRSAINGALTKATPALAAISNGPFCLAWQGHNDNAIYFAQYTDGSGWSKAAKLPIFETSAGPALAGDGAGNVQLVWKGKSDSHIFLATLGGNTAWSAANPGAGWSPQYSLPTVATSAQPALAAQPSTTEVVLSFKGASSNDIWVTRIIELFPVNIGVKMQYQESSEWCWIANATSINHYYNKSSSLTQCALMTTIGHNINNFPSNTGACPSAAAVATVPGLAAILASPYRPNAYTVLDNTSLGIPNEYLKTGGVGDALNVKGNSASSTNSLPPLSTLKSEISAGRPVVVDIAWNGNGGQHDVTIAGIEGDLLLICDPIFGESAIPYDSFPSAYQGGATVNSAYLTKSGT